MYVHMREFNLLCMIKKQYKQFTIPHTGGKIYENENRLYKRKRELRKVEEDAQCTLCDSCVKVCPTHIDIKKGPGQLECINCLECVDACTEVQSAFNRPSLDYLDK